MKKTVIVTGANGGIGLNFSREMLKQNRQIILACRNEASGRVALKTLSNEFPNSSIALELVDMSNLESIKSFSKRILANYSRLDVLAHNAGVYFFDKERKTSADGIELNFAVHVVGPYALTVHLMPLLKATKDAKVITMSSTEHNGHPVDLKDLQLSQKFAEKGNMEAYSRSKWAGLAVMYELDRQFKETNYSLHSLAAHPGVSITGIQNKGNPTAIQKVAIWLFGKIIAGKPEDASQPLVIASLQGISGQFYGPTGFKQLKGKAGLVDADIKTKDRDYGKEIIHQLSELTGLDILDVLSH